MTGPAGSQREGGHLDEEDLLAIAVAGGVMPDAADSAWEHVRGCGQCRDAHEQWLAVVGAVRAMDDDLAVPSFDTLIAPRLGAATVAADAVVPARTHGASACGAPAGPGLLRSIRLVARVTARQAALVPRLLAPATLGVLCLAAVAQAQWPHGGHTMLSRVIELTMVLSVVFGMTPANDPRSELGWALPVSPRVVVICRLLLVLGLAMTGAVAATLTLSATTQGANSFGAVLAGWLGPSLLAAACTAVTLLRWGRASAVLAGFVAWALAPALVHRMPAAAGSAVTAALALALLAIALARMNRWATRTAA